MADKSGGVDTGLLDQLSALLTNHAVILSSLAALIAIVAGVYAFVRFVLPKKPDRRAVSEGFATKFLDDARAREQELKADIKDLRSHNDNLKDRLREAEIREKELSALQSRLADKEKAVEDAKDAVRRIVGELSEARAGADQAVDEKLDAALEALEDGDFNAARKKLEAIQENATDQAAIGRQARIAFSLGTIAEQEIDYGAAMAHLRRAHELDPEDIDILLAYARLARLAADLALSEHAANRLRDLVDKTPPEFDNASEREAEVSNAIGLSLNQRAEFAAAHTYLNRALEIRQRVLGEEHPDTATSYNNVALNLKAQGR